MEYNRLKMYLLVFGGAYCPIVYRVLYRNIHQVVQDFFDRIIWYCLGVFPRSQAIQLLKDFAEKSLSYNTPLKMNMESEK